MLFEMMQLKQNNVNKLMGVCLNSPDICCVWEYCTKGSLEDIIANDSIALDDMFKFTICIDLLRVSFTYLTFCSTRLV